MASLFGTYASLKLGSLGALCSDRSSQGGSAARADFVLSCPAGLQTVKVWATGGIFGQVLAMEPFCGTVSLGKVGSPSGTSTIFTCPTGECHLLP